MSKAHRGGSGNRSPFLVPSPAVWPTSQRSPTSNGCIFPQREQEPGRSSLTPSLFSLAGKRAAQHRPMALRGTPGDIAQMGERLPCKQEASGSIPLISTIRRTRLLPGNLKPRRSRINTWRRHQWSGTALLVESEKVPCLCAVRKRQAEDYSLMRLIPANHKEKRFRLTQPAEGLRCTVIFCGRCSTVRSRGEDVET